MGARCPTTCRSAATKWRDLLRARGWSSPSHAHPRAVPAAERAALRRLPRRVGGHLRALRCAAGRWAGAGARRIRASMAPPARRLERSDSASGCASAGTASNGCRLSLSRATIKRRRRPTALRISRFSPPSTGASSPRCPSTTRAAPTWPHADQRRAARRHRAHGIRYFLGSVRSHLRHHGAWRPIATSTVPTAPARSATRKWCSGTLPTSSASGAQVPQRENLRDARAARSDDCGDCAPRRAVDRRSAPLQSRPVKAASPRMPRSTCQNTSLPWARDVAYWHRPPSRPGPATSSMSSCASISQPDEWDSPAVDEACSNDSALALPRRGPKRARSWRRCSLYVMQGSTHERTGGDPRRLPIER